MTHLPANTPKPDGEDSGLTLIETLFVLAIVAILAAVAIPEITEQLQQSETAKAVRTVYSAWSSLATSAVAADGATLRQNGPSLVLISGATVSGQQMSWSVPIHTAISMNGKPFACLSLDGDGIPSNTPQCPLTLNKNTLPDFQVSLNGGPYVPALP